MKANRNRVATADDIADNTKIIEQTVVEAGRHHNQTGRNLTT